MEESQFNTNSEPCQNISYWTSCLSSELPPPPTHTHTHTHTYLHSPSRGKKTSEGGNERENEQGMAWTAVIRELDTLSRKVERSTCDGTSSRQCFFIYVFLQCACQGSPHHQIQDPDHPLMLPCSSERWITPWTWSRSAFECLTMPAHRDSHYNGIKEAMFLQQQLLCFCTVSSHQSSLTRTHTSLDKAAINGRVACAGAWTCRHTLQFVCARVH